MALQQRAVKRLFTVAFQNRSYSAPADRSIPAAKQKYVPTEGIYPKGFLAGSAHAGVKASNTKHDDIALVVSETPCQAAAVFTRNKFQAAPIAASRRSLGATKGKGIRGVVVNSGCANAITGDRGFRNANAMGFAADRCFDGEAFPETRSKGSFAPLPRTLVMSTGVIGQQLPIGKIQDAIPRAHAALGSDHEHWMNVAQAICTTDTFPKLLSRTFRLPSHPQTEYRIAGMVKGAGMIHPNMGTLLGIICTDAKLDESILHALRAATTSSFNSISIDGDTSTNDTVALFANGAAAPANAEPIHYVSNRATYKSTQEGGWNEDAMAFYAVLKTIMTDLAKLVVRDGEGATKFVTIRVRSDVSKYTANRVAKSIATSNLVKTALYGKDANWGRILCAIGYAPGIIEDTHAQIPSQKYMNRDGKEVEVQQIKPSIVSVSFIPSDGSEELKLLVRGEPEEVDEKRAKEILEMEDLEIFVRLEDHRAEKMEQNQGKEVHEVLFWTCDFSHEYVTINGDYRT